MFTDPSFSTPQGGGLKGVNSPNPSPPPPRPRRRRRGLLRRNRRPERWTPEVSHSHLPLTHRPMPVALAGFLPKTGPKPPQSQGNQAKPPAHHSTTTTARLARSPGAAPTRSPRQARPLAGPPTTAAATTAALAGKPSESALSWAILAGTLANAACTDSHTAHHTQPRLTPYPPEPQAPPPG